MMMKWKKLGVKKRLRIQMNEMMGMTCRGKTLSMKKRLRLKLRKLKVVTLILLRLK